MWSSPAYWNNTIYFWGSGDQGGIGGLLESVPITNGLPDFTHIATNSMLLYFPGATPSISSNGTNFGTAILGAIDSSQCGSGALRPVRQWFTRTTLRNYELEVLQERATKSCIAGDRTSP